MKKLKEEPAALKGFQSHINDTSAFMSYNGRTFDVPFIQERLTYYRMQPDLERTHFDLLHFSRRAWKDKLPNCKLGTIEKQLLGINRTQDIPGALVPEFYDTYTKTGNFGPVIPIIEHNKQDLISLANIFTKLQEEWK